MVDEGGGLALRLTWSAAPTEALVLLIGEKFKGGGGSYKGRRESDN